MPLLVLLAVKPGKLQLGAAGKNNFLRYSLMRLFLNLKRCLAFSLSENRHTSQKYNTEVFPVFLLENLEQLTRNYYWKQTLFFLPDFLQKVVISLEYFARTECKLKRCNLMNSEMRTVDKNTFSLPSQNLQIFPPKPNETGPKRS